MQIENLKQFASNIASYCGLSEAVESTNTKTAIDQLTAGTTAIDDYLSYRYFDDRDGLFIGDGVVGFMLELTPIVGVDEGLHKNLMHFFNDELPADSYLQFLLVASHDVKHILDNWQASRTNTHPILNKIMTKRAKFVRKCATTFGSSDGRIARDYRLFLSFSQTTRKYSDCSHITNFKTTLISKLDSLGLPPRGLGATDLIGLVRTILQMKLDAREDESINYDPHTTLARQIVTPGHVQEITQDQINHKSTGLVSRCFHLKELPGEFSLEQSINLLGDSRRDTMGIAARVVISYTVASNISKSSQHAITARGKKVIDSAEKWYSRHDRDIKREAAQWQDINDRSNNGEQLLSEHWALMITSTASTIEVVSQNIISLYNLNNFRLNVTKNLQLPSLLSILPMQQGLLWNSLYRFKLTRLVQSQEVIARLPIHTEWKGVPKSGVLLHARRGQLFNFNPFYKIQFCIFAPSGGGKSVFLQELAVSLMAQNTRMFILDIGQSFANICNLLEGEIINFGRNAPFSLNPFASFHSDMSPEDKDEFLKCTKAYLKLCVGLVMIQGAVLI